ncbi:MAG TPA: hypothetical protein VE640_03630, partial [Candidatus Bathyarchaeia archaeon]|nr:hypothetical protein [Candidatus Bathyarchaeia archaeon]
GTTRDPFVEALSAERARAESFLERYGKGPVSGSAEVRSEHAETLPAADPMTAATAALDPDATRPVASDDASDDTPPDRG